MEKLSRTAMANKILMELYNMYSKLPDEELSTQFYTYLKNDGNGKDLLTSSSCFHYQIAPKNLDIYKKDSILEILGIGYGYLAYLKTFCKITEVEEEILNDLDTLSFSTSNLIEYFRSEENESKMKTLLLDYFVYLTQGNNFIENCKNYLLEEPPEFYDKLCRQICYIEVIDSFVNIYNEIMDMDSSEDNLFDEGLNFEEEYDEERSLFYKDDDDESYYRAFLDFIGRQHQIFLHILQFLDNYYASQSDRDDFIGYFMSLFYAFLLDERKQQDITPEEEEILKQLNQKNLSLQVAVDLFYCSEEYLLTILDLFVERYNDQNGDIFAIREKFNSSFYHKKFKIMDFLYDSPKQKSCGDINVIYYGEPISKVFDNMLLEIREKNPTNYMAVIWDLLRNPESNKTIFQENGLDLEYSSFYQHFMIKYLSRKYIEIARFSSIKSFHLGELMFYRELMRAIENDESLLPLFDMGYTFIISGYYYIVEKGKSYEKDAIYNLKDDYQFSQLERLDFSCTADSTYRKAICESTFYQILEKNGVQKTREYLEQLFQQNFGRAVEYLKEVWVSNYYYAKRENCTDDISSYIIDSIEGDIGFGEYLQELLVNMPLLEELLQRYLNHETGENYPLSYQEKLESSTMAKQKLYCKDI